MAFGRNQHKMFSSLREVLHQSRNSDAIALIPSRLETIFRLYDNPNLDPGFRTDIFHLLQDSCAIAEALADNTYSADEVQGHSSNLLQIIARLHTHLAQRPALDGFTIVTPHNGAIVSPFCRSRGEAKGHLDSLRAMGVTIDCVITPAKLTSQHTIQPAYRQLPPPIQVFDHDHQPPSASPPPLPGTSEVTINNPQPTEEERIRKDAEAVAKQFAPTVPKEPVLP